MNRPGVPAWTCGAHLSVIVPLLNEASVLPDLLPHLRDLRQQGCEVILVDGGSTDGGVEMARGPGFEVLRSATGRALQMNAGARRASGAILMFLHADTRLPENGIAAIRAGLEDGRRCWGRFDVRIIGKSAWLPVVSLLMNWRSRWSGIATGDQAIFVTRAAFDEIGGFPEQPLMEDVALCRLLRRRSRPACLRVRAITSGRRWDSRGPLRTVLLMWGLRAAYAVGVAPGRLARIYR